MNQVKYVKYRQIRTIPLCTLDERGIILQIQVSKVIPLQRRQLVKYSRYPNTINGCSERTELTNQVKYGKYRQIRQIHLCRLGEKSTILQNRVHRVYTLGSESNRYPLRKTLCSLGESTIPFYSPIFNTYTCNSRKEVHPYSPIFDMMQHGKRGKEVKWFLVLPKQEAFLKS